MRFGLFSKVLALLLAATLLSAPMAEAESKIGEGGAEQAKEAISELVEEEVTEDLGVGERQPVHKHPAKSGKPRMATTGVRQTWDECVGMEVTEAIDLIKAARPDLKRIVKVPEGSMVTMDMRRDRVRVYCNAEGIVIRPPRVG